MRTVLPKDARVVPPHAKRVFKGIIFDVYQWQQKLFDGTEATFEMLKRPDTVEIVAIKDGNIVAIMDEQPQRQAVLTLPGGRHDRPAETELDCAKRELHEETGMRFKTWRLIAAMQPQEKIERMFYTFLATDFEGQDEPHVDAGEIIVPKLISFAESKRLAQKGASKYWPNDLLCRVNSLEELLALPEYS